MRLDPHDLRLFYKLHKALMLFVNQRLMSSRIPSPAQIRSPSSPWKIGSSSVTPCWRTWT